MLQHQPVIQVQVAVQSVCYTGDAQAQIPIEFINKQV
jgi:hypothetical protein